MFLSATLCSAVQLQRMPGESQPTTTMLREDMYSKHIIPDGIFKTNTDRVVLDREATTKTANYVVYFKALHL